MLAGGWLAHPSLLSQLTDGQFAVQHQPEDGPAGWVGERDVFLASGAFPSDATVTMIAEAYQDDVAFQLYDATRGDRTIRVAEQLTVRDGRVASSNFVTDMAAFAAFAAAGAGSEGRGGGGQA